MLENIKIINGDSVYANQCTKESSAELGFYIWDQRLRKSMRSNHLEPKYSANGPTQRPCTIKKKKTNKTTKKATHTQSTIMKNTLIWLIIVLHTYSGCHYLRILDQSWSFNTFELAGLWIFHSFQNRTYSFGIANLRI